MVGPEAFTEVRYLAHHRQMEALELIPKVAEEFKAIFGRDSGGLIGEYRTEDAETIVITLGSVIGTMQEVIDEMRDAGEKIGAVTLRSFRPFPAAALRAAVGHAKRVIIFEKCLAVGIGGIVSNNVRMALSDNDLASYSVIGGLGGRPVTRDSLRKLFAAGVADQLDPTHFLDLQHDVVNRQIERSSTEHRPGPDAENILRDIGIVAAAKI
jgi:pyruvate ferredoxin oxidoreductase alpha subunit